MAYGLSNSQTRDPNMLKSTISQKLLELKTFKFGMPLCIGSAERAHK